MNDAERTLVRDGRLGRPGEEGVQGRTVRADVIRSLLLHTALPEEDDPLSCPAGGLRLYGATVQGKVDLSRASRCDGVPLPSLVLEGCVLEDGLDLTGVVLDSLSLVGSRFPRLEAREATIRGIVDISRVQPVTDAGPCRVDLRAARLESGLRASRASLSTPAPRPAEQRDPGSGDALYALDLTAVSASGSVELQPAFRAFGGVSLKSASIRGDIWCEGAYLVAGEGDAFNGQNLLLHGNLMLRLDERSKGETRTVRVRGLIRLFGADVRGDVWINGASPPRPTDPGPRWSEPEHDETSANGPAARAAEWSLSLTTVRIEGSVGIGSTHSADHGVHCRAIWLNDATIRGGLQLISLRMAGEDAGIYADNLRVEGDVHLGSAHGYCRACQYATPPWKEERATIDGPFWGQEVTVGGSLTIIGAKLTYINLDRSVVRGIVQVADTDAPVLSWKDGRIDGTITIGENTEAAPIPKSIILTDGVFGGRVEARNLRTRRFSLNGATLEKSLELRDSEAHYVDLSGIEAGSLRLQGLTIPPAPLATADRTRLTLRGAQVKGELRLARLHVSDAVAGGNLQQEDSDRQRLEHAVERLLGLRERRLSCYPGWHLVEALTSLPPAAGGEGAPAAEGRRAVLSFLWRDRNSGSWLSDGAAVLLDGSAYPFIVLNLVQPPRFGPRRPRALVKEYLVLFASYLWGDAGPFRVVRGRDLDRLGLQYELQPGKQFEAIRVEDLGGSAGRVSPRVRCTMLYGRDLFSAVLTIASTGAVTMTEDDHIGRLTSETHEEYERPFRIATSGAGFPPPGMVPTGLMRGTKRGPSGYGWWGGWKEVLPASRRGRRMKAALKGAIAPVPWVDLSDARAERLDDADGLAWGEAVRIDLDGFVYRRTPQPRFQRMFQELEAHAPEPGRSSGHDGFAGRLRTGLRSLLGQPAVGPLQAGTGDGAHRYRHRERWLNLQYKFGQQNGYEYRPHPYETLAAALRTEGATTDARRVLSQKLTIERRVKTPWYLKPFPWLFWAGFDYGLSTTRAAVTVLLFGLLGWLGTWYANEEELLIIDFTAAATAVAESAPGAAGDRRPGVLAAGAVAEEIHCGDEIQEAIYALDLMIPIIELGQEERCRVRTTAPDDSWLHRPWIWETFGTLYEIGGAIVLSIALLTFSGVLRRHAES